MASMTVYPHLSCISILSTPGYPVQVVYTNCTRILGARVAELRRDQIFRSASGASRAQFIGSLSIGWSCWLGRNHLGVIVVAGSPGQHVG